MIYGLPEKNPNEPVADDSGSDAAPRLASRWVGALRVTSAPPLLGKMELSDTEFSRIA